MSAYLYDQAILKKFNKWTERTNVHIYGPEDTRQLFELIADTTKDKPIQLPIITVTRPGGYEIINANKQPLSYDGRILNKEYAGSETALQLNAIPIQLTYQVNVYTRRYREADAYMRELIFNIINYPRLEVVIPYNDSNITHTCSMELNTSVDDNSSIPERLVPGQFTRLSISFMIVDAYLWDARTKPYIELDGTGLTVVSSDTDVISEPLDFNANN